MHLEATVIAPCPPYNIERRLELPTLGIALAVHSGFVWLTLFFRELPILLSAPLGSLLLAWYGSLQHETIHGHPTSSRRFNAILGALPLSLWMPYALYRETHLRHHRHSGRYLTEVDHDPESFYLSAGAMSKARGVRRWIYLANCTLAGRLTLGPALAIVRFWAAELGKILNGDRRRLRIWSWHALAVGVVLVWVVGVCHIPLIVYVALMIYPSVAISHLRSFAEHHGSFDPRLRTRVVEAHALWAVIFLNNNLHIAHHAYPKLPWYQLPRVWRDMRRPAQTEGLVFERGYWEVTQKYLFRRFIELNGDGS
ncbi:MAG: fatty acid desaturase [Steroidobacteraceae bacterium]